MKLIPVDGRTWWVPESRPFALAVPISTEKQYLHAIERRVCRDLQMR